MKHLVILMFIITTITTPWGIFAQDEPLEVDIEDESESTRWSELLDDLRQNPLDLNRATATELEQLFWISPLVAQSIVQWRQQHGVFEHLTDLLRFDGVDPALLAQIEPYVVVHTPPRREIHLESRHRWIDPDANEGVHLDATGKSYQRLRVEYGEHLAIGALAEKDPQETHWADFWSGYVELQHYHGIRRAVAGHYQVRLGQGLLFSNRSTLAKELRWIKSNGTGIKPYTASHENQGHRGIAAEIAYHRLTTRLFYGNTRRDATKNEDGTISGLDDSGDHSGSGADKKDVLAEQLIGFNINYAIQPEIQMGLTGYHNRYNRVFNPAIGESDAFYRFRGEEQTMLSADFNLYTTGWNLFGEVATDTGAGNALVLGGITQWKPLKIGILYRHYDVDFYSPHGQAFHEYDTRNEEGFYLGGELKATTNSRITGYIDLFWRQYRSYFEKLPPYGYEQYLELQYRFTPHITLTIRQKVRGKESRSTIHGTAETRWETRIHRRLQLDYQLSQTLSVRGRLEWYRQSYRHIHPGLESELMYGQIRWKPASSITLTGRWTMFGEGESAAISSRLPVYQYETDLPGMSRTVGLYGKGSKWFGVYQQKIGDQVLLTAKYEHQLQNDKNDQGYRSLRQYRLQLDTQF